MLVFPNAKINLGLNILKKRSDGFHDIASVFYPIGWKDALEVVEDESFSMTSSGLAVPGDWKNNLIYKAFLLVQEAFPSIKGCKVHLHKEIPMGAGMGGGSADGAFMISTLNHVFDLHLSVSEMEEMAAKLGSDCPFFIQNRTRYCFDRGTSFENFDIQLSGYHLVVVNPGIHISTAEAYAGVSPKIPEADLRSLLKEPIEQWQEKVKNDFEEALLVKYPIIATVKNKLLELGASYASMTGSGSTVYGIFKSEPKIQNQFEGMSVWKETLK